MKREPTSDPLKPFDKYGRSLEWDYRLDGRELVIKIMGADGIPYSIHKIPLRDLPPNANATCPLQLEARIKDIPAETLICSTDLMPWGGTGR